MGCYLIYYQMLLGSQQKNGLKNKDPALPLH